MGEDLTFEFPLTGVTIIDASSLKLGLKVRIHTIYFHIVEVPWPLATSYKTHTYVLLWQPSFIFEVLHQNMCNRRNWSFSSLYFKGEFYNIRHHTELPFEAQPFTVPRQPGYMLSVGLSEFTLNSASYRLYSAGLLQALINDSMVSVPLKPKRWSLSALNQVWC